MIEQQQSQETETKTKDKVGNGQTPTVVRRGAPRCPGVYVEGTIQDIDVWYTVDTGASRTIVSERVFKKISKGKSMNLSKEKEVPLEQADGNPLEDFGSTAMELHIGPLRIKKEVIVANIKDDVLLGMDIGESLDVITSSNKIVINGQEVPCVHVKSCGVRRVYTTEMVIVPGFSEIILDAVVEKEKFNNHQQQEDVVIEPALGFTKRHNLLMASSLVTIGEGNTGKVRVMNPENKSVKIQKNTVIGQAEPYYSHGELLLVEDEEEMSNMESVRRLKCVSEKRQNRPANINRKASESCDKSPPDMCQFDVEVLGTNAKMKPTPDTAVGLNLLPEVVDTMHKSGIEEEIVMGKDDSNVESRSGREYSKQGPKVDNSNIRGIGENEA
jgi:hypothetical protein